MLALLTCSSKGELEEGTRAIGGTVEEDGGRLLVIVE